MSALDTSPRPSAQSGEGEELRPALAQWNETQPPKDGTPVVIVGGIMVFDEFSTTKIPFCVCAHWSAEQKDWIRWEDGLSVRRSLSSEVIVHFWMPYPQAQPGDRPPYETHEGACWEDNCNGYL